MDIYGHRGTAEMETSVLSVELRGRFAGKRVPQIERLVNRRETWGEKWKAINDETGLDKAV
jgi:hypothetical protein